MIKKYGNQRERLKRRRAPKEKKEAGEKNGKRELKRKLRKRERERGRREH